MAKLELLKFYAKGYDDACALAATGERRHSEFLKVICGEKHGAIGSTGGTASADLELLLSCLRKIWRRIGEAIAAGQMNRFELNQLVAEELGKCL